MRSNTDLHIHSRYSDDGEYAPAALARMCAERGIGCFAIADHNTVAGVGEAMDEAARLGIRCVPAIEMDCTHEGIGFHVLGYEIDPADAYFAWVEQNIRDQSAQASRAQLALVNAQGFDVTEAELAAVTAGGYWPESWVGEAFAEVLLHAPRFAGSAQLAPYRPGGARSDNPLTNFYWDWCAQGKPCYVDMDYPSMADVVHAIHRAGGKAVLAHPGVNLAGRFEMAEALIPLGLDGIEVYSSYHSADVAAWFADVAQRHGLLATRGSDFHGKAKPAVKLGVTGR